jgi:hypothetical protein
LKASVSSASGALHSGEFKLKSGINVAPYGRVEIWRGNKESRFQTPLIKPDVRISRIRLSDKGIT